MGKFKKADSSNSHIHKMACHLFQPHQILSRMPQMQIKIASGNYLSETFHSLRQIQKFLPAWPLGYAPESNSHNCLCHDEGKTKQKISKPKTSFK